MNIAIVGGGYVGLHTALRLTKANKKFRITIFDIDESKINKFNNGDSPIDDFYMKKFISDNPYYFEKISYSKPPKEWTSFDMVFISLPTNPRDNNDASLYTELIFKMSEEIIANNKNISIVIRSTVNIGDYKKIESLGACYWPEFLSQGVETTKNINQPVNVVSIDKHDNKSKELFEDLFRGKKLIRASVKESILIKVMHNTLDAHLINLTNLFANICEENNISFLNVGSAVEDLLSKRTKIKRPGIGYGGSCYPKDSLSLIEITKNEQNRKLINSLDKFNNEQGNVFLNNKDLIINAKKILVLGSSFKGGTNDITKTPTIKLREWLLGNNIDYKIWEPMISEKWLINGEVISTKIEDDISNSDLIIVASDWVQFNDLLSHYDKTVIDLKSIIKENGKMNIYKIGEGRNG